ncbi:MAG: hypothetical protein AABW59_03770 [archaeon]
MGKKTIVLGVLLLGIILLAAIFVGVGYYTYFLNAPQEEVSKPLNFAVMVHLEKEAKITSAEVYKGTNQKVSEIIDLFEKYGAKATIESSESYANGAIKYGKNDNVLSYSLSKGMGVGTHCDMGDVAQITAKDFNAIKSRIDALVGPENNLGCSGGFFDGNWVETASLGGFKYLDGVVMLAYLGVPLENRPINPDTGAPYSDDEITNVYYHDPVLPVKDRIYPRMLKDTQDLNEDKDGTLLLITGGLGEISSLYEGRKNCFPDCRLTKEDTNYIMEQIDYANSIKDDSKTSALVIHFPVRTLTPQTKGLVEDWLEKMEEYQNQGKIKWVTVKEIYEDYIQNN